MSNTSRMIIDDGIASWFDGPEWDDVVAEAFENAASEVEGAAKADAPWEDRSGDARNGLSTSVENERGIITLNLFHTVEHGLWLEVIQNGRFATIMPTLERYASKVMRNAEGRVRSARRGRN